MFYPIEYNNYYSTFLCDETASDVKLTDIERQKEREAEICLANTEQLIGLQEWAKGQQDIE